MVFVADLSGRSVVKEMGLRLENRSVVFLADLSGRSVVKEVSLR